MHRYDSLARVFLAGRAYVVRSARPQGDTLLLALEGVDSREAADALRNVEIDVPLAERAPLAPDRFYLDDLLGLRVIDPAGRLVGTVVEVLERPAAEVLRIRMADGGEGLVPLVRAIVQQVDLAAGEVRIDPPRGLLPEHAPGGGLA